jgi:hypothetical protein
VGIHTNLVVRKVATCKTFQRRVLALGEHVRKRVRNEQDEKEAVYRGAYQARAFGSVQGRLWLAAARGEDARERQTHMDGPSFLSMSFPWKPAFLNASASSGIRMSVAESANPANPTEADSAGSGPPVPGRSGRRTTASERGAIPYGMELWTFI